MVASSETNSTISGTQTYTLTIADDTGDKPTARFYNSSNAVAVSDAVAENVSGGTYAVTVWLDKVSEKTVTSLIVLYDCEC